MSFSRIDLPYLGDRNYIQGATILDMIFKELQPEFPLEVKFHSLIFGAVGIGALGRGTPNVSVSCRKNGQTVSYRLIDLGDGKLDNRAPFDESRIAALCQWSDKKVVSPHNADFSLITRLVSMNKSFMSRMHPGRVGKWVISGLSAHAWPNQASLVELEFQGGLGTRLTRSHVRIDGDKIGQLFFSLMATQ